MTDAALSPTARSTIHRRKERAVLDRAALYSILDAGLVCHLGVLVDAVPRVVPTGYGRDDNTLYIHGSTGSTSLRNADCVTVCVVITLLDGLIYARSVFHHSFTYRSAMIYGTAHTLTDDDKVHGLRVITEHLAPGSWGHARHPNPKELAMTEVVALELTEASVKIRTGGPEDESEDTQADTSWAGVLPLETRWGTIIPDQQHPPATPAPGHVTRRIGSAVYT